MIKPYFMLFKQDEDLLTCEKWPWEFEQGGYKKEDLKREAAGLMEMWRDAMASECEGDFMIKPSFTIIEVGDDFDCSDAALEKMETDMNRP